jgi:7,8-dihydropterin-6-yl-methyl-4-(beta-D-ribofuranosyl)aminobenzene 5'-phosphate synthase
MQITTLVENSRSPERRDLRNEWGLSFHIIHQNQRILFDMGSSGAFIQNATRLGCPIEDIDVAVISHHHFDHGGGLGPFLRANQKARVYLCGNTKDCYVQVFGFLKRYVGLDKQLFKRYADRIEFISKPTPLSPQIILINEIQRVYPLPRGDRFLFVKSEGHFMLDDFAHELLMVIREEDGLTAMSHK